MEVCDDNIAAARCGVGGGVVRRSGVVHVCGGGDHVFVAMFEGFAIRGCSVHVRLILYALVDVGDVLGSRRLLFFLAVKKSSSKKWDNSGLFNMARFSQCVSRVLTCSQHYPRVLMCNVRDLSVSLLSGVGALC